MCTIRIGSGAGFSDDRIEPAVELARRGNLDYLVFECLAERSVALATVEKLANPSLGYNEWLEDRMDAVLPECHRQGIRIITNMGAANPAAAGQLVADVAARHGITGLKIAVVTGDDVLSDVVGSGLPLLERDDTLDSLGDTIVSANAYLGAAAVVEALRDDADVIITGRIADPSLYLAPLIFEFSWRTDDWDLIAAGVAVGHLLECTGHVTGGYFADPGFKDVPNIERLGFPIAEVSDDGAFIVTKVEGTGGEVSVRTCTEQILYEVHDPSNYPSADVVADFSGVRFEQVGPDRVSVSGIKGRSRPQQLKVSVGYRDSWIGEGQVSYTGINAVGRGRLALNIVKARLELIGVKTTESHFELIGVDAVHRGAAVDRNPATPPQEVRVRVACRTADRAQARRVGHEVFGLGLNGPYGGGGFSRRVEEVIAIVSVFLDRSLVPTTIDYIDL